MRMVSPSLLGKQVRISTPMSTDIQNANLRRKTLIDCVRILCFVCAARGIPVDPDRVDDGVVGGPSYPLPRTGTARAGMLDGHACPPAALPACARPPASAWVGWGGSWERRQDSQTGDLCRHFGSQGALCTSRTCLFALPPWPFCKLRLLSRGVPMDTPAIPEFTCIVVRGRGGVTQVGHAPRPAQD